MEDTIRSIYQYIIEGDKDQVEALVATALRNGIAPGTILEAGMIPAMQEVGERFEAGELFIPEMLIAARAMKAGLETLRPQLQLAEIEPAGRVVMATVEGDLHDIGKNLVGMMLEGAGFEIIDLGTNVPADTIVEALREHQPMIVGLSALLTTTMQRMPDAIEAIRCAGLRESVHIMVGGAPLTQGFASSIGADSYSPDAPSASRKARELAQVPRAGLAGQ